MKSWERPYQSLFASIAIKPLVSEEKDHYLALASLVDIRQFIPNIDTSKNFDLLPVAFNACVVNRGNKNTDIVDTATALAFADQFVHKPINVEHNRQKVIGVILSVGFSEFGTDKPLSRETVQAMTTPFNITLGGIVWRTVCSELANKIEESNDPTSIGYLSVSASWELGFTGYRIALFESGKKNLADASQIISDPKAVEAVQSHLTALQGDGKINDLFAYRMPSYDVIPLGIGFTEKPAAEVKGIATPTRPIGQDKKESVSKETNKNTDKISQTSKSNVKIGENKVMKITSLKELTDETLKECSASVVSDFISAELKKGSDQWVTEKNQLNETLAKAQAESQRIQAEYEGVKQKLAEVQKTVETLANEKTEREKVESFNTRMNQITEAFELDEEAKAAVIEEVKAIASEEDFGKWMKRASVLLKGFAKKCKGQKKEKECCEEEEMEAKKAKAAAEAAAAAEEAKKKEEAAKVAQAALDNAKEQKSGLPNSSGAATPSLMEKGKVAFARENIIVTK